MSRPGRAIGPLINLNRQKRHSLIFISQEARQIDINVLSQLDWLAIKETSALAQEFERKELRQFTDKAMAEFNALRGNKRPWIWVYSEPADFSGMVKNELPSFWRPALSRAFADSGPSASIQRSSQSIMPTKGERTSTDELKKKAGRCAEPDIPILRSARCWA